MKGRRETGRGDQAGKLVKSGRALWQKGNLKGAAGKFEKAVKLDPGRKSAWNDLGAVLMSLGRGKQALRCFEKSLKIDPDYPYALINMGRFLLASGALDRAGTAFERVLRSQPRQVDALFNLAQVFRRKKELEQSESLLRRAVQLEPGHLDSWLVLAQVLADLGSWSAADECYRRADAVQPGNLVALTGRLLGLPKVYPDVADLERARAGFRDGLAALEGRLDQALARPPEERLIAAQHANFLLAYQGRDDLELQKAFSRFQAGLLKSVLPRCYQPLTQHAEPDRRISVGFVSGHFYQCTVGKYFSGWVTGLDRDVFETRVFSIGAQSDELNRRVRESCDQYSELPGSLSASADMIANAALDVLIYPELGMHRQVFALANMRLAPLQCAAWGHPVTSGHENVDWFFSVGDMEPAGAQSHYSERLVTLPGIGTCYSRPEWPERASRASLGLPEEGVLCLFPQSLFKIHPDNDALLAEVLAREPRAWLVLFRDRHAAITDLFSARLDKALRARGLNPGERRVFLPRAGHGAYLQINRACDLMLDSLHWSGGNTALDALACGLPVVALPGEFMRGRQTMAMLGALGMEELVAASKEDYLEIAVALARDDARRESLRAAIRDRNSALFDQKAPLRALQDLLTAACRETAPGQGAR